MATVIMEQDNRLQSMGLALQFLESLSARKTQEKVAMRGLGIQEEYQRGLIDVAKGEQEWKKDYYGKLGMATLMEQETAATVQPKLAEAALETAGAQKISAGAQQTAAEATMITAKSEADVKTNLMAAQKKLIESQADFQSKQGDLFVAQAGVMLSSEMRAVQDDILKRKAYGMSIEEDQLKLNALKTMDAKEYAKILFQSNREQMLKNEIDSLTKLAQISSNAMGIYKGIADTYAQKEDLNYKMMTGVAALTREGIFEKGDPAVQASIANILSQKTDLPGGWGSIFSSGGWFGKSGYKMMSLPQAMEEYRNGWAKAEDVWGSFGVELAKQGYKFDQSTKTIVEPTKGPASPQVGRTPVGTSPQPSQSNWGVGGMWIPQIPSSGTLNR